MMLILFGFAAVLLAVSTILLILWISLRKRIFAFILGGIWLLVFLYSTFNENPAKKIDLTKADYYGNYIIDRSFYPGPQAEWQYNHYRFYIRDNDSIYFYVTNKEKIIRAYIGKIYTVKPFDSERLSIAMPYPTHHILNSGATVYRTKTGFYLVFRSPRYGNVFFKKGNWPE
ncbi:MAG: hypothetical protein QM534_10540 [Sediminibacterium sp.]|nr:hypothetical protein [Sediminibacterium sp.]